MASLRNHFLTGVILVAPIGITVYIALGFIQVVDSIVKPLVPDVYNPDTYLPFSLPGFGLLIAVAVFTLLGTVAANIFGYTTISYGEKLVNQMPIFRNIYNLLKQIFETVFSQEGRSFKEAGLIEFPRPGYYAVVFLSGVVDKGIGGRVAGGEEMVSVFLPTAPNPTSGFLLFVPRKSVTILDISIEQAAKLVISAGIIMPDKTITPDEGGTAWLGK